MTDHYLRFKSFPDKETAEDFAQLLKGKNIVYFIEADELVFDPSYANNAFDKEYVITVRQADFEKAHRAFRAYFKNMVENVNSDYYLFSFTVNELKEIVAKPDEWGDFDYHLALKLLEEKGLPVSEEQQEGLRKERLESLKKSDGEPVSNIIGYYFICVLFFPMGFVIGWIWAFSRRILPNGARVHIYNEEVQKHGRIIFMLAFVLLFLTAFGNLFSLFSLLTSMLY